MKRNVSLRLGGEGAPEVKRMLEDIAVSGDASAKRMAASFRRAGEDVEAALQRQANAQAKLAAFAPGVTPAKAEAWAGNSEVSGRSAQASAAVFSAAYQQMEQRARALVLAIDPVARAQDRFNSEMAEARTLVSAGVLTLDQYVAKLGHERAALDAVSAAQRRGGVSAGAHRQAMAGASYQVQDFFTQVSMGANPVNAFAVQGAQLAGQFSNIEGKAGTVARFFMGPWGMAITAGLLVASMFTKGLFEQGETLDDLVDKLRKEAEESRRAARAKEMFGKTVEGLEEALRLQTEQLAASNDAHKTAAERSRDAVQANVAEAQSLVAKAKARLEDQRAMLVIQRDRATTGGPRSEIAASSLGRYEANIREAEAALLRVEQVEVRLRNHVIAFGVDVAIEQGKRANDAAAQINRRYDAEIAAIQRRGRAAATAGRDATQWAERETAAIERRRKADLDAEAERTREAGRRIGLGTQLTTERSAQLLATAQRYSGLREDRAGDRSSLKALFAEAGQNVDPKMVAWCAAFVNAVLATNGLPGTDSLSARSFLNYGTATNSPQQGDIVVLRRGNNAAQGHVGFYAGTDGNGRVRVTGGNQGDEVSTASFARSDVLGFRRAPTEAASFRDAQKAEEDRATALARLTERYDPLTAAATRFREVLAEIDKLAPEGAQAMKAEAQRQYLGQRADALGAAIGMAGVQVVADEEQKIVDLQTERDKRRAESLAQMLTGQADSIAMARGELDLVAANDNLREASLSKLRLILDLKRLGVDADSAEYRQLLQNEEALSAIHTQIERQRVAWDEIRGFGNQFAETVLSPDTWEDWGAGGQRILKMLQSEMIRLALLNPLKNLINGDSALPTIGSLIGRLGGKGGGAGAGEMTSFLGSLFSGAPGNAAGTEHSSGGAMLVGEHGREVLWAPRGSRVTNAGDTARMLAGNDNRPGGITINVDAKDAVLAETVRGWVAEGIGVASARGAAGGAAMSAAGAQSARRRRLGRSW